MLNLQAFTVETFLLSPQLQNMECLLQIKSGPGDVIGFGAYITLFNEMLVTTTLHCLVFFMDNTSIHH